MTTYKEAMEYVEELGRYGSVPGLDNIRNLCKKLGNPQEELAFIHVAGTNGKGSVSAFIFEILRAAGYRAGRYISPVIFDYRERIQVGGRVIGKKDLCRLMTKMREICGELTAEGKPHPTAFEIETAMAFCYFREKNCQLVVLETGLGGELDATNIVANTVAAVFTSISFDHMKILGGTLEKIAENKAGIMKPGAFAVAQKGAAEVMGVLEKKANALSVPLTVVDPQEALGVKRSLEKQVFSYAGYKNLTITLPGSWQVENAMVSVQVIKKLKEAGYRIPDRAVYRGLENTFWPGRFQVLSKKPYFIADGAHNGDAAARLAETIRFYFTNKRIIYIIGILRDKAQDEILRATCPLAEQILTISTKGERGLSAYELACMAKKYHPNVTSADSVEEAVELAYLLADEKAVIIAFGSLSYLGNLIKAVEDFSAKKNGAPREVLYGKQGKN
ncbi:MAG: bifunctional folylpolyglutamate synthase/dihydrofolate synthase [Clostridium sp.]|nr:bifunctional folylpolyglutamate synthase/dihydrofolate synthase [Clostridium sp.]